MALRVSSNHSILDLVDQYKQLSWFHSKKLIGAHVSMAGKDGHCHALINAASIGARAVAFDVKNKRQWIAKEITQDVCDKFKQTCQQFEIPPHALLPHGSYLINLASPKTEMVEKSKNALKDELERCKNSVSNNGIGIREVAQKTEKKQQAIHQIAEAINWVHKQVPEVITVLENAAGGANVIGNTFEEIAQILKLVQDKTRVGVCIDTCHAFAAGMDVRKTADIHKLIQHFDDTIGLKYLKGMHINDSKGGLKCARDRHENIGAGHIGYECFHALVNDPRLDNIPLILETPVPENDLQNTEIYKKEIAMLYSFIGIKIEDLPKHKPPANFMPLSSQRKKTDASDDDIKVKKRKGASIKRKIDQSIEDGTEKDADEENTQSKPRERARRKKKNDSD